MKSSNKPADVADELQENMLLQHHNMSTMLLWASALQLACKPFIFPSSFIMLLNTSHSQAVRANHYDFNNCLKVRTDALAPILQAQTINVARHFQTTWTSQVHEARYTYSSKRLL